MQAMPGGNSVSYFNRFQRLFGRNVGEIVGSVVG
jgi:hypothetical protein